MLNLRRVNTFLRENTIFVLSSKTNTIANLNEVVVTGCQWQTVLLLLWLSASLSQAAAWHVVV